MKNADSPAMPTLKIEEYKCSEGLPAGCFQTKQRTVNHNGLKKSEMFAMNAMQGILSNSGGVIQSNPMSGTGWCNSSSQDLAKWSIECADALLAELDK